MATRRRRDVWIVPRELPGLLERAHETHGHVPVGFHPVAVHCQVDIDHEEFHARDVVPLAIRTQHTAGQPGLPDEETVNVISQERGQHLRRLDIDDFNIVKGHVVACKGLLRRDFQAGADGDTHFLAAHVLDRVDAVSHTIPW